MSQSAIISPSGPLATDSARFVRRGKNDQKLLVQRKKDGKAADSNLLDSVWCSDGEGSKQKAGNAISFRATPAVEMEFCICN